MSLCGWCSTGHHLQCRGTTQRWYIETKKGKSKIIYLDEYTECSCPNKHKKPDAKRPVENLELL